MTYALEVRDLEKSFSSGFFGKKKKILKRVSFSVRPGQTTGFIGVNGSGKTTSLKCILNFIFPENGNVRFFGHSDLNNEVRGKLGYLPERPYLYDFLTAREFLSFHWNLSGGGTGFSQTAKEVLHKVNLHGVEDRRLRNFSKGMLQRIGMAQALLRKPDFLILDEPMSGLDPDGRILIKDIIRQEQKRGTTIFFSSHLLSDMEELCQDVVVIDAGEILYQGSLLDLSYQFPMDYRIVTYDRLTKSLQEQDCSQDKVQVIIDDCRIRNLEVRKVTPLSTGIELAFVKLRERHHEKNS
jgi:ABC-2 type transport system ATP-binding protein